MEIYLIRHTKPAIEKGTCYGQADLDVVESFLLEANDLAQHLPADIELIYSSPLKRCRQLAEHLFPNHSIQFDNRIKEIDCGDWELQPWDQLDQQLLKEWMSDFVNICIPGGESYAQLYKRTTHFFDQLPQQKRIAIVAHGGVLRSILSYINGIDLKESFDIFSLFYGCVIKIENKNKQLSHTILHNPALEKEQHRPSFK